MAEESLRVGDAVYIREEWSQRHWFYGAGLVVRAQTYLDDGTYYLVRWTHDATWHRIEELELVSERG